MNAEHQRPEGVRIVTGDGRTIPCELRFVGVIHGVSTWRAMTEYRYNAAGGDSLNIDVLPARTAVQLEVVDVEIEHISSAPTEGGRSSK